MGLSFKNELVVLMFSVSCFLSLFCVTIFFCWVSCFLNRENKLLVEGLWVDATIEDDRRQILADFGNVGTVT